MKKVLFVLCGAVLAAGCEPAPDDVAAKSQNPATVIADAAAADAPDSVVAVVNGVEIPASRLLLYTRGQPVGDAEREAVVENAVTGELVMQAAMALGMDERPDVRDELVFARQNVLGRVYVQDLFEQNPIDDAVVEARYAELVGELQSEQQYEVAHILVEEEALALDLLRQVREDPSVFGALAGEHSKDPGSGQNEGKLGWMSPQTLVPEFAAAMQAMEAGDLSEAPVQTQFGYHIIRVDAVREAETPELTDELRQRILQQEQAQVVRANIEKLREAATVEFK